MEERCPPHHWLVEHDDAHKQEVGRCARCGDTKVFTNRPRGAYGRTKYKPKEDAWETSD